MRSHPGVKCFCPGGALFFFVHCWSFMSLGKLGSRGPTYFDQFSQIEPDWLSPTISISACLLFAFSRAILMPVPRKTRISKCSSFVSCPNAIPSKWKRKLPISKDPWSKFREKGDRSRRLISRYFGKSYFLYRQNNFTLLSPCLTSRNLQGKFYLDLQASSKHVQR